MAEKRPDPEVLLRRAHEEERQEKRGKLKIYFGAAPGVGKTYTMLQDANARRAQDLDVVVGIVESHGRVEIETLMKDLEILPRQQVNYRGRQLSEFDLDAALKRNPALILVDEMAHTNVPGVRHEKRWQDIKELLYRGIDVYTTLNVQHVESLNDIVTQITGIVVRETVPDSILEQADAIELIDLPPEDLLKRLEDGKVYVPDTAQLAIQKFFRKGNLIALRELALRITAEQVNAQVYLHRRGEAIKRIWPTVERILVCVGPEASTAKLIRAAFRMARSLHAEWIAVYVEAPRLRLTKQQRNNAIQNLRLAEQLGGETVTLNGKDPVQEIMSFARLRNVTKIIIGKHIRPRWRTLLVGSLVDELVRQSGEIDLYIVQGEAEGTKSSETYTTIHPKTPWTDYAISLFTVGICTAINNLMYQQLNLCSLVMVYLLGIVYVATRGRFIPAILTTVLSIISLDFFFIPPRFTFAMKDPQYIITLLVTFMVSYVISHLIIVNQQQIEDARERELRTATMYILSRRLASVRGLQNLLDVAVIHLREVFNCQAMILLPDQYKQLEIRTDHHYPLSLTAKEKSVAQWVFNMDQIAGLGTQTLPDSEAVYLPLHGTHGSVGVLRVLPSNPGELQSPEQLHLLEGFANQIALAIEVDQLEDEARISALKNEADRLLGALLKSVSHNLRIPLLQIMESANYVIQKDVCEEDPSIRKSMFTITQYTEQLNSLINNLLQITQLETGALRLHKELHPLREVIDRALFNLNRRIGKRKIIIDLPDNFPRIYFEPILLEQVFIQLVDNALKYSTPDTPIELSAAIEGDNAKIKIANQGQELMPEEIQKVFDRFYRGQTTHMGMGLGLTICQSIIKAHGGNIWAENRLGGGVIFNFTLPMHH